MAHCNIYRNDLKNQEFDKEDPQNFCSEQAPSGFPADVSSEGVRAIAFGQGASENENDEVNPTTLKTDSSGCFGINPKIDGFLNFVGSFFYTQRDSKIGFVVRRLSSIFFVFAARLASGNGRLLQPKNLESILRQFPIFELRCVYRRQWLWLILIHCICFPLFSQTNKTSFDPRASDRSTLIESKPLSRQGSLSLSYRMGYFRPSNETIREIYHKGISYQLEFDWSFWKGFFFFSNVDYFSNSGKSINFHSDTQVRIVGWLNGFGYLYQWAPWIGWYAGIGPKAFFYHNRDHAPYIKKNVSQTTAGFGTKAGLAIFPFRWVLIDLFIDYSYGRVHFYSRKTSNILRFSTNAGGLTIGGGVGARF